MVLHVHRDSERDAAGVGGLRWQFQRDVIIEQPLISLTSARCKACLQLLRVAKKMRHSYWEF